MRKTQNTSRRNQSAKSAGKALRELIPRAIVYTPSADPPTIISNPVKKVVVDLFVPTVTTAPVPIILSTVRTQILGQTGLPLLSQNFNLKQMAAWVSTGNVAAQTSQSISLKMLEPVFLVEARDDPSPMTNARVGILYPKNVQPFFRNDSSANSLIATLFSSSNTAAGITVRLWIDLWGTS